MKPKLTLALVAIITSSAFAAIPKVLPEFKNEKQLAEWRAEMAENSHPQTANEDHTFYTGKPYIGSTGSYAFKYRSYNPDLARWTSEDPSGFPDGANGSAYVSIPTTSLDPDGLSDLTIVGAVVEIWKSAGFTFSVRLAEHSLDQLDDRDAEQDEINALNSANQFTSVFNKAYFSGKHSVGETSGTQLIDYSGISDLGHSYGRVSFDYSISLSGSSSFNVDFAFSDRYDFNPRSNNGAIQAFNRLQQLGIATIFDSSGTFSKFYE